MAKTVAVYSMKGGVGKTTLAVNFAYCATTISSRKTLLWDIDAQGAASFLCAQERPDAKVKRVFSREVEPSALVEPTQWPMLDLLAADMSLRHLDRMLSDTEKPKRLRKLLQMLSTGYDRIILDCPPGLGEVSDQLFRAADLIVVPVPPTPLALRSLEQVQDHLDHNHERKPLLLPVISMVDRRKKLHREFLVEHPDWPVIPHASVVERMAVERSPVTAYAGNSPAAKAISDLWVEIERILEGMQRSSGQIAPRKIPRIRAARG
jgi:chromosome partitioning protein